MFAWMQEKAVNEHLALTDPAQFVDSQWNSDLLSTRCRLLSHEEQYGARQTRSRTEQVSLKQTPDKREDHSETATLEVPPAAFDLIWATDSSTAPLQVGAIRTCYTVVSKSHF